MDPNNWQNPTSTRVPLFERNIAWSIPGQTCGFSRKDWNVTQIGFIELLTCESSSKYYLRNKKVPTCNVCSFIDIETKINQLQIHERLVLAPFDWITAAVHQGNGLQSLSRYYGVMAFQTFLAIFSWPILLLRLHL